MGYTGRHRKTSSLKIAKRNVAMVAAFAGIATTAGAGTATAAPAPGFASIAEDVLGGAFQGAGQAVAPTQSTARPASGEFTSGYGPRWGTHHNGIDIANVVGTPIYAVLGGTVIDSGPAQGFGQWVRVKSDDGIMTVYGHVSARLVQVGQRVTAGQPIALMGNEGFSTGSHLHFEVWVNDGKDRIDPEGWLREHGLELGPYVG